MTKVVSTVPLSRFERFGIFFPQEWETVYLPNYDEDSLADEVEKADFLFVMSVHTVTEKVIANARKLKLIHTEGVGYNAVDCEAAKERGIYVCNNCAVNNGAVAEHTIGLMLAGLRRTVLTDEQIKKGAFEPCQRTHRSSGSNELCNRRVGLIGFGAIGKEVAKRLIPFGCDVYYYDAFRATPEQEKSAHVTYMDFNDLIRTCNILSLHVPVLPNTVNMLSTKQFDVMSEDTLVVNTSRGEIIDQDALADALINNKIYGAALDTFYPEPPGKENPLINLPENAMKRLTLTPHIAGTTDEAFTRMLKNAIANMRSMLEGKKPVNIVNNAG